MEQSKLGNCRDVGAPFLICRTNDSLCALPLNSVVETMRPLPVKSLAAMPPFVLGVSVIRGVPVPIVDAARLVGANAVAAPRRFVTLRVGERCVGLAVESVIGVRIIPAASLEEIPPLVRDIADETVSSISTLDAQLLVVLQSAHIAPESVWQALQPEHLQQ
jgi:purine-binding chemotaxis protein CheW